jgi:RHS repeat-associated protein
MGAVTNSYEYDAYGNEFTVSGTTPNEMMYRGEQYDSDLGLYYLRARYYNPLTGRFMSRDPLDGNQLDPATLHKYLYANGDPIDTIDPMGREGLVEFAAKVGKVVAVGVAVANAVLQCTKLLNEASYDIQLISAGGVKSQAQATYLENNLLIQAGVCGVSADGALALAWLAAATW